RVRQFYWWKSLTLPAAFRWSASTWMTILSHLSMLRSYPLVTGQSVHQRSFFLLRLLVQLLAWRFQHQVLPAPPPERYVPDPLSLFRVRQFYWWKSLTLPAAFRWSVSTWMTILSHLSMLRSYPLVTEQSVRQKFFFCCSCLFNFLLGVFSIKLRLRRRLTGTFRTGLRAFEFGNFIGGNR